MNRYLEALEKQNAELKRLEDYNKQTIEMLQQTITRLKNKINDLENKNIELEINLRDKRNCLQIALNYLNKEQFNDYIERSTK